MKRIALLFVLACGLVSAVGCDTAKRKADETVRGLTERAAGNVQDKATEAGRKITDSAVDSATGDSEKDADAEKRKKLKGNGDE